MMLFKRKTRPHTQIHNMSSHERKKKFQLKKVFPKRESSLVTLICDEAFPSAMLMLEKKTFCISFSVFFSSLICTLFALISFLLLEFVIK
jgi:hypothetical protein